MEDKEFAQLIRIAKEEAWDEGYWDGLVDQSKNQGLPIKDFTTFHLNPYEN